MNIIKTLPILISGDTKYPINVKRVLQYYGNIPINNITIVRTELSTPLVNAINFVSNGEFKKRQENTPYDKLYHLSIICNLNNNKNVVIEKNERLNVVIGNRNGERKTIQTHNINMNQLLNATHQKMGNNFFPYSAKDNNCQDFILNLLQANHLDNPDLVNFVKQHTKELFDDDTRKISNTVTDLAAKSNMLINGGLVNNIYPNNIMDKYVFRLSLSNPQINKLNKKQSFQIDAKQIQGLGDFTNHKRYELHTHKQLINKLNRAHKNKTGARIEGGDIMDFFHRVGDTIKDGYNWVKDNIPKDAIKMGAKTAIGAFAPEAIPLAFPLVDGLTDYAYGNPQQTQQSQQPITNNYISQPFSNDQNDVGVKVPLGEYKLFLEWKKKYFSEGRKDEDFGPVGMPYNSIDGSGIKKIKQIKVNDNQVDIDASKPITNMDGKRIINYDINSFTPKVIKNDTSTINNPSTSRVDISNVKRIKKGKGFIDYNIGVHHNHVVKNDPYLPRELPQLSQGNGLGKRPPKGSPQMKEYMAKMRSMKGNKKGNGIGSDMDDFFGGDIKPPKLKRGSGFIDDCRDFFGGEIKKKRGKGLKRFFTDTIPNNSKQILKTTANNTPYVSVIAEPVIDPEIDKLPTGGKLKRGKFIKGSIEAREFMASIRAKRKMKGGSFKELG